MKTPNFLEIPKDSPSRKERIESFKRLHGIQTHDAGSEWPRSDLRWCALLFELAWGHFSGYCKEKSLVGLMAGACRLVDEYGLVGFGDTEIEAIHDLCSQNKIHCPF